MCVCLFIVSNSLYIGVLFHSIKKCGHAGCAVVRVGGRQQVDSPAGRRGAGREASSALEPSG